MVGLVTHLLARHEERQQERFHQQLERHDLLVLDELGYVPFSKAGARLLFEVVSRADERTSLLVTTNLPFEIWVEVMANERLTGALLDRLTHRIHILEANGESFRLRESQRRLKQGTRPTTTEHNVQENLTPVAWRGISRAGAGHSPATRRAFQTTFTA